jgi:molybdenum cofactor synthesis domain-containing protein
MLSGRQEAAKSRRNGKKTGGGGLERTAAILVIGNEILTGKVEESNARYLSGELFALGVRLRRIVVVPDEVAVIASAVRELRAQVDHLFTSGGVGPTHDDLTIEGIAAALDRPVVRVEPLAQLLRHYYGERCNDDVLRMADAPEGYELLSCSDKHWPVLAVENVVILPGVPEIFRRKFESIRERFRTTPFTLELIYTSLDEGLLAQHLNAVTAAFPDVAVGSYPTFSQPDYKVKVTIESKNADHVARAAAFLRDRLPAGTLVVTPAAP